MVSPAATPKPKFRCQAKHPETCQYHGVFIQMENAISKGEFSDYEQARAKAEELNRRSEEYADSEKQLTAKNFRSRFRAFFNPDKSKPAEDPVTLPFLANNRRFALEGNAGEQIEFESFDKNKLPNLQGFIRADAITPEIMARLQRYNDETEVDNQLTEARKTLILNGELPITDANITTYFTNPQLKTRQPTMEGWTADNDTHQYVIAEMIDAILDSESTALENSGLKKSAYERVHENDGERTEAISVAGKGSESEPGYDGRISEYDEGWLYAFHDGFNQAKTAPFLPNIELSQEEQLKDFLIGQRSRWIEKHNRDKSLFNEGALDAYDNWLDTL